MVLDKDQTLVSVMENLGSTNMEAALILALTALLLPTASLAFIMMPIACGAVKLENVKNGVPLWVVDKSMLALVMFMTVAATV